MTAAPTAAADTSEAENFTVVQCEQFAADDVVAGSAIGKMLSILFLYTVFAMTFVAWWTFSQNSSSPEKNPTVQADH